MTMQTTDERTMLIAHAQERRQAHDLLVRIGDDVESLTIEIRDRRKAPVPRELAAIITQVLEVMAKGGTVQIGSLPEELTTTVAAEQLGISRPTLMKLIRDGEIPAHKVGTHHRLRTADVRSFRWKRLEHQRRALEELVLTAEADDLGCKIHECSSPADKGLGTCTCDHGSAVLHVTFGG